MNIPIKYIENKLLWRQNFQDFCNLAQFDIKYLKKGDMHDIII